MTFNQSLARGIAKERAKASVEHYPGGCRKNTQQSWRENIDEVGPQYPRG